MLDESFLEYYEPIYNFINDELLNFNYNKNMKNIFLKNYY